MHGRIVFSNVEDCNVINRVVSQRDRCSSLDPLVLEGRTEGQTSSKLNTVCHPYRMVIFTWLTCAAFLFPSRLSHGQVTSLPPTYNPTVVGGLPPRSKGLEQPVYVADRSMPTANFPISIGDMEFPNYADPNLEQTPNTAPRVDMKKFLAGEPVAIIGEERILVGHLMDPKKVTPEIVDSYSFEPQLRKALVEVVMRKALSQKFIRDQISGKPLKEQEEGRRKIQAKLTQAFYDKALPDIMKSQKCETLDQFTAVLGKSGMTLTNLKDDWAERMLANECVRDNVKEKPQIELSELVDHYETHANDYQQLAKARFQILTATFAKYPNRSAAMDAIVEMGNQVFFGAPFETIAKNLSSGFNAKEGGHFDWVSKGALKSKSIDEAVFTLPLQKLSQVIEDSDGYHIVRVLERKDAYVVPFSEVQSDIRKKLADTKRKQEEKDFLAKVRDETPIWTRWPEDIPGAMPISQVIE